MWYIPFDQPHICESPLADQYNADEFSKLPSEIQLHILKMTFGTTPGQVASGLANIEKVSTKWRELALTELWKLAVKQFFSPQQIENARNHLFQQLNREPSWKEIYLSLITRTVRMTFELLPKKSSPLYIPAGSHLRFYTENTGSNLMSYAIDADKNISEYRLVPGLLTPELVSGWLNPDEKINKIIPINISANYKLKLYCINEGIDLGVDSLYVSYPRKCTGFAQMTLV